jgi:tetratricopeptide (TPR) repeat protein
MFERYLEDARRTIFFARYEAAKHGSPEITPEHILLALVRDGSTFANGQLARVSPQKIRAEILAYLPQHEQQSPPGPIALSLESQKMLAAAEDAVERLGHRKVADYHLLLGLMHEQNCFAAQLLRRDGVSLDDLHVPVLAAMQIRQRSDAAAELTPTERRVGELENRVIGLMQGKDYRGALKVVDDAIADTSLGGNRALRGLLSMAGATARILGDMDAATRYYELQVACDPDSALAHFGLASCLKEQGKADEAREVATKSYQLSVAQDGAIGEGLAERIEKEFPEITPQA